jgi:hypothetical protein
MKILVDKMPVCPDECPFSKRHSSPRFSDLMVCTLSTVLQDGHRTHCVCKPKYCLHLKEVTPDGRPNEDRSC